MPRLFYLLPLLLITLPAWAADLPPNIAREPETFDWLPYVDEASSTYEQKERAEQGIKLLQQRMEKILEAYRKRLEARHAAEELRRLTEMQAAWEKAAEAEVAFVASTWSGGTGAKVAFPRARLECELRQVKVLLGLRSRCLALND